MPALMQKEAGSSHKDRTRDGVRVIVVQTIIVSGPLSGGQIKVTDASASDSGVVCAMATRPA